MEKQGDVCGRGLGDMSLGRPLKVHREARTWYGVKPRQLWWMMNPNGAKLLVVGGNSARDRRRTLAARQMLDARWHTVNFMQSSKPQITMRGESSSLSREPKSDFCFRNRSNKPLFGKNNWQYKRSLIFMAINWVYTANLHRLNISSCSCFLSDCCFYRMAFEFTPMA